MVLTPRFSLTQTPTHVCVHIILPNVRVSGMELTVLSSNDLSFYCRPYLLRLTLPGEVHDEEDLDESKRPRAAYDPNKDNGTVTVYLVKRRPGEQFEGLDMITSLLKVSAARPRVGKGRFGLGVDGAGRYGFANGFQDFFGEDGFLEEFPDLIDLPHPDETSKEARTMLRMMHEDTMFSVERYRADLFHGTEDHLYQMAWEYEPDWIREQAKDADAQVVSKFESLEIASPAKPQLTSTVHALQVSRENPMSPSMIGSTSVLHAAIPNTPALSSGNPNTLTSPFASSSAESAFGLFRFGSSPSTTDASSTPVFKFGSAPQSSENAGTFTFSAGIAQATQSVASPSPPLTASAATGFFTDKESRQLSLLTAKEFSSEAVQFALLKILDVLLAFCYENRMSCGDFSVESHWTLRKLSATLSWLEEFSKVEDVFKSFARRSLCFPYLRRWDLCCRAALDCRDLLRDPRWVLRALLRVQDLLSKSQSAYLLNRLFLDDMCIWVQLPENRKTIAVQSREVRDALRLTFDLSRKVPGPELVEWNLAKASSSRRIDNATLATSHLKGSPARSTAFVSPANERNVIEELD